MLCVCGSVIRERLLSYPFAPESVKPPDHHHEPLPRRIRNEAVEIGPTVLRSANASVDVFRPPSSHGLRRIAGVPEVGSRGPVLRPTDQQGVHAQDAADGSCGPRRFRRVLPAEKSEPAQADKPEGRWRMFPCDELVARDKFSLDVFWLKDGSLEDSSKLPDPHVLAAEIAEDLRSALEQIESILGDLEDRAAVVNPRTGGRLQCAHDRAWGGRRHLAFTASL